MSVIVPVSLRRFARRLRRDNSGLALIEFAFAMPVVFGIGAYGIEIANLALTNLRVSQIAMSLADNASRVGIIDSSYDIQQLREIDINDVLQGARLQGDNIELTRYGRVTLSSLENHDGEQRIHWQRCIGLKNGTDWDSSYGTTDPKDGTKNNKPSQGTLVSGGMGEPGKKVTAPEGSAVMFVELNYQYRPLFGDWLVGEQRLHYTASFIIRDNRDLQQIYNPAPAADRATCDKHSI